MAQLHNHDIRVLPYNYRPFDNRYIYWSELMVDWPRSEINNNMLDESNIALVICRQSISDKWAHIMVAKGLIDACYISSQSSETATIYPLNINNSNEGFEFGNSKEPNFSPAFLKDISAAIDTPQSEKNGIPKGFIPEDILYYIYAILSSPLYRTRYEEFLKTDFPKVQLPKSINFFKQISELGSKLVKFHLLDFLTESYDLNVVLRDSKNIVEKVSYSDETIWINRDKTFGFKEIPEEVWKFQIGGYSVCEKWLKDRQPKKGRNQSEGQPLLENDINHFHKIIIAIKETINTMNEIDQRINDHGKLSDVFIFSKKDS